MNCDFVTKVIILHLYIYINNTNISSYKIMKKLLFTLVLSVASMVCLQSCTTTYATAYEPYDEEYVISDNADVNIIITYGTPYYYEGQLWYYLYNGLYYYPFHYNGYWYFRPYATLYSWDWYYYHYHHFTPHYRDYRFRPHHHDWNKPHHNGRPGGPGRVHPDHPRGHQPNVGHGGRRPNSGGIVRPNGNGNHPRPNGNGGINNGRPRPSHTPSTVRPSSRPSSGSMGRPGEGHRPSGGGMSRPSSGRRH